MPTATRPLATCSLIPARRRCAYPVVTCLVQRADGATAEERAPYAEERPVEVYYAEESAGRTGEGYLVRLKDNSEVEGYLERDRGMWFYATARGIRSIVSANGVTCDGKQRADTIVVNEDAPGRVLLNPSWGTGYRTRTEALAQAGFVAA